MSYRVCVDIGGTFTDLYLVDDDGEAQSFKAPTTPGRVVHGLFDVIKLAADFHDQSTAAFLGDIEQFVHGSTISTNAILEDEVARTALLTTEGFLDVLWLHPHKDKNPFEWIEYPDPYVPRALTYGITERVNAEGEVLTQLDEADVREALADLEQRGVEAVAVSFMFAQQNSTHERRVGELIEEISPDLEYSLSHEVNPVIREHRRTSSTAIDASLYGLVDDYLATLGDRLAERGYDGPLLIITANGGVMASEQVRASPIWTVDSGPTMLPVAARNATRRELSVDDVVALDMGGTSLDMCVVSDGEVPRDDQAEVGEGHVLGVEKVGVKSIGSGGGSIAWVDDGGLLNVGPDSAGADPGPVCYGRGNDEPTVTDAALALGYYDERYFLGGRMEVDRDAARAAVEERVADPLGVDTDEAAHAVYKTVTQNMVNGIKEVTVEQGIDPRKYVLSGGGGALGTFAVEIARELRMDDVVLPAEAGVVSSIGGLASDLRKDFVRSRFTTSDDFDREGVTRAVESLLADAESFYTSADIDPERRATSVYMDARYPHQVWELTVKIPLETVEDGDVDRLVKLFDRRHEQVHGFSMDEAVEFVKWRVEANGERPDVIPAEREAAADPDPSDARYDTRQASFGGDSRESPAYVAEQLDPGHTVSGPAFVDADNTTIVLPPDAELTVTGYGNYHVVP